MEIKNLQELYKITKERLEGEHGSIAVTFANRTHIYEGNDVIGNCLQEWLPDWFRYLGVDIKKGESTQKFPDFIATFDGEEFAVEVKAWNMNNAPGFDLANFYSFIDTTFSSPDKLNAYYFILGYKPADDSFQQGFTVEKVFLKNIWEITSGTSKYPIGLQVKRNSPYAMRPYNFHRKPDDAFKNRTEFVDAVEEAYELFPNDSLGFTPKEWHYEVTNLLPVDAPSPASEAHK